jgi:flagellar protein FlgJ
VTGVHGVGVGRFSAGLPEQRAQLRRVANELEGLFLSQLFQAMRNTVPDGGLVESSSGEEMFRAMLDEQLAREAAIRWEGGIGEALYEQLSRHLIDAQNPHSD